MTLSNTPLRLAFCIPPPDQRVGGLELAINSLHDALLANGTRVELDPARIEDFDVIHFHGLWQPRFLSVAKSCRRLEKPYIVSPHGMLEPWAWRHRWWKKWPYFLLAERRFLNGAHSILATSQIEEDHLRDFRLRPPLTTIPLGLAGNFREGYPQARSNLGWTNDKFCLLYLSRIHPKKGLHLLLSALVALSLDRSQYRLIIVGDGPQDYLNSLHSFANAHREALPDISWVGPVWDDSKWKYLQAADLFCLPTQSENFGLAILESCQVGTPVLTTSETPWKDFLARHGFPVAAPTSGSVRETLQIFLKAGKLGSDKRRRLAEETRAEFDWTNLSARYLAFYSGLVRSVSTDGRV
jgi:glycosyltransferase involved in cell wall biosynthesis